MSWLTAANDDESLQLDLLMQQMEMADKNNLPVPGDGLTTRLQCLQVVIGTCRVRRIESERGVSERGR